MSVANLTIDLDAVVSNWRALDNMGRAETAAVVKADGYGLGAARVARALAEAGARTFFVAATEEGAELRHQLGHDVRICVFSGHMARDTDTLQALDLIPMLNSPSQAARHMEALPEHPFGVQLDTGMNRLGMEPTEWADLRGDLLAKGPELIMSHLACADEPDHPMNRQQLAQFHAMTDGTTAARSLSATGGTLLGPDFHFDLVRPGVGLYGGLPFADATPTITLSVPIIQARDVAAGETVGYGNSWTAAGPRRIATVAAGYADGLHRAMGHDRGLRLWHGDIPCPVIGRVSMDMITVDITDLEHTPDALDLFGPGQLIDDLADMAGTIGYEILTSLGNRYSRTYIGG